MKYRLIIAALLGALALAANPAAAEPTLELGQRAYGAPDGTSYQPKSAAPAARDEGRPGGQDAGSTSRQ